MRAVSFPDTSLTGKFAEAAICSGISIVAGWRTRNVDIRQSVQSVGISASKQPREGAILSQEYLQRCEIETGKGRSCALIDILEFFLFMSFVRRLKEAL
jgi:hypothetical protein